MRDLTDAEKQAYNVCVGAPLPTAIELADLRAQFAAADRKLALIEVTTALWEAGANALTDQARHAMGDWNRATFVARADANRAHAETVREILKAG